MKKRDSKVANETKRKLHPNTSDSSLESVNQALKRITGSSFEKNHNFQKEKILHRLFGIVYLLDGLVGDMLKDHIEHLKAKKRKKIGTDSV